MQSLFAVVRNTQTEDTLTYPFKFSKFHVTQLAAVEEAMRLAEKEKDRFLVLKVVGMAQIKSNPVEYIDV